MAEKLSKMLGQAVFELEVGDRQPPSRYAGSSIILLIHFLIFLLPDVMLIILSICCNFSMSFVQFPDVFKHSGHMLLGQAVFESEVGDRQDFMARYGKSYL